MRKRTSGTQSGFLTAWDVDECRTHRLAGSCKRPLDGQSTAVHGPRECIFQAVVLHTGSPHRGQQYIVFVRFFCFWSIGNEGKRDKKSEMLFRKPGLGYWRMPNTPNTQACGPNRARIRVGRFGRGHRESASFKRWWCTTSAQQHRGTLHATPLPATLPTNGAVTTIPR